jgi:hypothetical protein
MQAFRYQSKRSACPCFLIGLELDYRVPCYQVHGMDRHRQTQQDIRIQED